MTVLENTTVTVLAVTVIEPTLSVGSDRNRLWYSPIFKSISINCLGFMGDFEDATMYFEGLVVELQECSFNIWRFPPSSVSDKSASHFTGV
ncbi:hypothetical protein KEJ34_00470 [Candidatus Bathyarchaeota archaeon]|nr:hypothetical protein [Candidatus Bathyarchaeota archaeon]